MKKAKTFGLLLGGIFLSIAAICITYVENNLDVLQFGAEEKTYSITLNKEKNVIDQITAQEETPENANQQNYSEARFEVKSNTGADNIIFFVTGAFVNPNGVVSLNYNGTIGNSYLKKHETHNKINGLKSLLVNYTGGPLNVNYSYEEDMANGYYRVMNRSIKSGVPYNFDNNYPEYFAIATELRQTTYIESIEVSYSCNADNKKLPTTPYYIPGYHVGNIPEHSGLENAFKGQGSNDAECFEVIREAIARHYEYVTVDFNYDNQLSAEAFVYYRLDMSHVDFISVQYEKGLNKTNTFKLVYFGQSNANVDVNFSDAVDPEETAYKYDFKPAQYVTHLTEANMHYLFENGNSARRKRYYRENNLTRDPNFNNFAIDKLDASREFPIYNSEDLWYAASKDYKPKFMLENSKAEWIYNEARKALIDCVNDSMTDYEKLRAIFEWITENCEYDRDALNSSRVFFESNCYYLEGVFERNIAVCDGFSKAFVLMGKIEGLDVLRGVGFTDNTEGHAWAYARTNSNEPYYLICPTWGDQSVRVTMDKDERIYGYTSYEAFMTAYDYFPTASNPTRDFHDLLNKYQNLAKEPIKPSVYALDKSLNNPEHSLEINTEEDLAIAFKEIYPEVNDQKDGFTIHLRFMNPALVEKAEEIFKANELDTHKYGVRGIKKELYGITTYVYIFPLLR